MKDGFVNVLKPSGMNSNYAVVGIRRLVEKGVKVGHMGTLDPAAAGVLPIGIGFAARLFDYIIEKEKEYVFELTLGLTTDTQDAEGKVTSYSGKTVSRTAVNDVLDRFVGTICQQPPAYSAVVKNGQKLYAIARAGGDTTVAQRIVQVSRLEILEQLSDARFLMRVACGRGVYVRTLCHDIGQVLGCGGICSFLLRTKAGAFDLKNSIPLEDLIHTNTFELLPVDFPIAHMTPVYLPACLTAKVRNGAPVSIDSISSFRPIEDREQVRVYLCGKFVGIGQRRDKILCFVSLMTPEEIDDAVR